MKKFIFALCALFFLGASVMDLTAQDRTYTFNSGTYYYSLPYRAADSVSRNDTAWYFQWLLNGVAWPNKTDVKITFDELSGVADAAISLQGKKFSGDSWSNISTVNYKGGGSDTTFTISDGTARLYRYYRLYIDKAATAGKGEVDLLEVKIWQTQ